VCIAERRDRTCRAGQKAGNAADPGQGPRFSWETTRAIWFSATKRITASRAGLRGHREESKAASTSRHVAKRLAFYQSRKSGAAVSRRDAAIALAPFDTEWEPTNRTQSHLAKPSRYCKPQREPSDRRAAVQEDVEESKTRDGTLDAARDPFSRSRNRVQGTKADRRSLPRVIERALNGRNRHIRLPSSAKISSKRHKE